MKKSSITHSFKPDWKTVQKNRRIRLKGLCFKLSSLLPPNHLDQSKEMLSQQDQIDKAIAYITQLKDRIEGLKVRKELMEGKNGLHINIDRSSRSGSSPSSLLPVIDLREWDSGFELTLMSEVYKNFRLYEVINILEEEGTEVVSVSSSKVGDKIIHSIHAKVSSISRVGVKTTRMCERLQDLIYSF